MLPNCKVFHRGTLREHFQAVVKASGSQPVWEKGLKSGEKLIEPFICIMKMQFMLQSWWEIDKR